MIDNNIYIKQNRKLKQKNNNFYLKLSLNNDTNRIQTKNKHHIYCYVSTPGSNKCCLLFQSFIFSNTIVIMGFVSLILWEQVWEELVRYILTTSIVARSSTSFLKLPRARLSRRGGPFIYNYNIALVSMHNLGVFYVCFQT